MSAQALMEHAVALRDAYEGAVQRGDMDAANAIAPSFSEAIGALAEMGIGVPTGDGKGTYGPAEGESGDVNVGQESDGSTGVTATASTEAAPSAPSAGFSLGLELGQAPPAPTMTQAESAAALRSSANRSGANFGDDNEMESANNAFFPTEAAMPGLVGAAQSAREAVSAREGQIAQNEEKISALEQMNIESERDNSTFSAISEAAAARDSQNQASSNARGASELSAGHTMSDEGPSAGNAFTEGPGEGQSNSPGTSDGLGEGQSSGGAQSFGGTSTGNGFTEGQTGMPGSYSNEMESGNSAFVDAATTGVGDESGNAFSSVSEGRGNYLDGQAAQAAAAFAPAGEQLAADGSFLDGQLGNAVASKDGKDGDNSSGLTGGFAERGESSSTSSAGSGQSNSNSNSNGNAFSGNAFSNSPAVAGFTERSGDSGTGIWGGNAFGEWGGSAFGSAAFGDAANAMGGAWGGGWGSEAFGGSSGLGESQGGGGFSW